MILSRSQRSSGQSSCMAAEVKIYGVVIAPTFAATVRLSWDRVVTKFETTVHMWAPGGCPPLLYAAKPWKSSPFLSCGTSCGRGGLSGLLGMNSICNCLGAAWASPVWPLGPSRCWPSRLATASLVAASWRPTSPTGWDFVFAIAFPPWPPDRMPRSYQPPMPTLAASFWKYLTSRT
jgi:hypothetical protein